MYKTFIISLTVSTIIDLFSSEYEFTDNFKLPEKAIKDFEEYGYILVRQDPLIIDYNNAESFSKRDNACIV